MWEEAEWCEVKPDCGGGEGVLREEGSEYEREVVVDVTDLEREATVNFVSVDAEGSSIGDDSVLLLLLT